MSPRFRIGWLRRLLSAKLLLSIAASALTIWAFVPYIRDIRNGTYTPHFFSWIIWAITTTIVAIAQFSAKGGLGAWPILLSGLITAYVAYLAFTKKSTLRITRTDWVFFWGALLSIPVWYLTADPLWSVIILTTIDLFGFWPTLRKSWTHPQEESSGFYVLMGIRNLLACIALESYSWTTLLFPALIALGCGLVIGILYYRKKPR